MKKLLIYLSVIGAFENLLLSVVADGLLICSVFIPLTPLLRIGQAGAVNVQTYIVIRRI
jgi:hypothetical protein